MKPHRLLTGPVPRLVSTLVLALLPALAPAQDRAGLERRLQSVSTLIEGSSAAGQIESSGVPAARERRDKARALQRDAAAALAAGDLAGAARLLDQATREMMDGARLARPDQVKGEKDKRDFESRLESARALLGAQQRIVQEKSAGADAQQATRQIEADLEQARALAAQGRWSDGRVLLDKAYLTARVSIESMRRGDTLVRSLAFASAREEFDYEVDRNDTHRMLINVLLADRKDASGAMPPAMRPFIERAEALRRDADAAGRSGDHAAGIKSLEASTGELVRAIRAGGIYIPG
ncbi:MAG: hypothetical protein U1F56_10285 [Rubrivivax sp.]